MRNDFVQKLERVDEDMRLENGNAGVGEFESNEDERLSRRLDAGLFSLQVRKHRLLVLFITTALTRDLADDGYHTRLAYCRG